MVALKDQGIEQQIKFLLKEDKIKLVDDQNQEVYKNQITKVANYEEHNSSFNDSDIEGGKFEYDVDNEDDAVSPDGKKTHLVSFIYFLKFIRK